MHRVFAAGAVIGLGAAISATSAFANGDSATVETPSFSSLQRIDTQPLSRDEMQRIAGMGGKVGGDPSVLAQLLAGLSPAQAAQLAQIVAKAQQNGIALPPMLVQTIRNRTGIEANGTEAQGTEQVDSSEDEETSHVS